MTPIEKYLSEVEAANLGCLIPKPGVNMPSCHEKTICDCTVLTLVECLRLATEALQLIDMRKEGFEEDLVQCPPIAYEALAALEARIKERK